jgi:hypothetical protein
MKYDQKIIVCFLHNEGVQLDQIHTRVEAQSEDDSNSLNSVQY